MGKLVNNSHFIELFLFWDDSTKASSSFPHRQKNIYVHTPRAILMGDQQCLVRGTALKHLRWPTQPALTRKLVSGGSDKCSSPLEPTSGCQRKAPHTQSQLTLSRWAAAPSRWCSTRHTWKGIPSPPWHPSCKLCQWLPYLPQTEQCWLFCTRQLRSLWGQKAGPGSFIMSKLIATQHKDIFSTTGWRNFPPREERSNKCSILSRSLPKVMLACSCRFSLLNIQM